MIRKEDLKNGVGIDVSSFREKGCPISGKNGEPLNAIDFLIAIGRISDRIANGKTKPLWSESQSIETTVTVERSR